MMAATTMLLPIKKPLPHGRGSDAESRSASEAIRAATVRERLLRRRTGEAHQ
jgi:hypothetical protein